MSIVQQQPAAKPLSNFELETKIRLIIKELLETTSTKLTDFTTRIDSYERFYFTFTDRVSRIEGEQRGTREQIDRLLAHVNTQYEKMNSMEIRSKDRLEKSTQLFEQLSGGFTQVKQTQEQFRKQLQRLTEESSRTKNFYVEQKKLLQEYRDEASDRILKFVSHNVEINRDVNSKFDELSRQQEKIKLAFETRKKEFEECFATFRQQEYINKEVGLQMNELSTKLEEKASSHEMHSNGKQLRLWVDGRMYEFEKVAVAKVEGIVNSHEGLKRYGNDIKELQGRLEHTQTELGDHVRNLLVRANGSEAKLQGKLDKFSAQLSKENAQLQRDLMKKIQDAKSEMYEFRTQQANSVQELKSQLMNKLKQETSQMMESKNEKAALSEQMMQQLEKARQADFKHLNQRIGDAQSYLSGEIQQLQAKMEKIPTQRKYTSEDGGGAATAELAKQLEERLQQHDEQLNRLNIKVEYLQGANIKNMERQQLVDERAAEFYRATTSRMEATEKRCKDILDENQATVDRMLRDYEALKSSVQQKMESVYSSVTKCRSDVVVIGDSFATRFQQLVRKHDTEQRKTQGILKVVPMIAQCINLLLAMRFDSEYQRSRTGVDAPASETVENFTSLNDGKLYEYRQKRKQGTIFYRNRIVRKIDLVKAHLSCFIDVWDSLQGNEFREQFSFFPKDFFKTTVEKKLNALTELPSPKRPKTQQTPQKPAQESPMEGIQEEPHQPLALQFPLAVPPSQLPTISQQATNKINRHTEQSEDRITDPNGRTFHIRQPQSTTQKKFSVSFIEGTSPNDRGGGSKQAKKRTGL